MQTVSAGGFAKTSVIAMKAKCVSLVNIARSPRRWIDGSTGRGLSPPGIFSRSTLFTMLAHCASASRILCASVRGGALLAGWLAQFIRTGVH